MIVGNANDQEFVKAEKKRNIRIAITVGAAGAIGGILFYIAYFAIFFTNPFIMFSLLPIPDFETDVVLLKDKIILISTRPDFKNASFAEEPKMLHFMREFNGSELSKPIEIKPYGSITADGDRIYFIDRGGYRTFDGNNWTHVKSRAIGNDPHAASSPDGLWVLSKFKGKTGLYLIDSKGGYREIGLPSLDDHDWNGDTYCYQKLLYQNNKLHLFCGRYKGEMRHWTYESGNWAETEIPGTVGQGKIINVGDAIYLFYRDEQKDPFGGVKFVKFEDSAWAEPMDAAIPKDNIVLDFHPVQYQGKPAIITQGFLSKMFYFDAADGARSVKLGGSIATKWLVLITTIPTALFSLIVFSFSFVVNKYKTSRWSHDGREMEYASLFRRYLAHMIDMIILLVPVGAGVWFIFDSFSIIAVNPLKFIAMVFMFVIVMIVGTLAYYVLFEGLWSRTPGKWICGIMVLKDDLTPCTLWPAFLRTLLRIGDGMFYHLVAAVTVGATLKWQRLGDLVANTVVVRKR